MLYGPPGCGKTMLAKATAGECDAKFINVSLVDVLDMYEGESERRLHALFEKARAQTPTVLFFDELEGLAGKRSSKSSRSQDQLVSQFLTELDGFAAQNNGVLVLAATNLPWSVDNAFRRPGRFDRLFFVPPPDKLARLEILKGLLAEVSHDSDLNLDAVAERTTTFSGADLMHLIELACDAAIDESLDHGREVPVNQLMLMEAQERVKPSTLEWLSTARNYARYANEGGQYDDVLDFLKKHGK